MAHTPAPWKVINREGNLSIETDDYFIARAWNGVFTTKGNDDHADNANLIAAAPELLDALKTLKAALGPEGDYSICRSDGKPIKFCESVFVGDWFEKADAAIAKAEGEQNG